jgi:RNA-directed DNA polymerase
LQPLRCAQGVTASGQSLRAAPARYACGHYSINTKKLSTLTLRQAATEIAIAFQSGAPDIWAMGKAVSQTIDADSGLLRRLARDVVLQFGPRIAVVTHMEIAEFLNAHPSLAWAFNPYEEDDAEAGEEDEEDGEDEAEEASLEPSASAYAAPTRKRFIIPNATQRPPYWPVPAYNLPRLDHIADLAALLEIDLQRLNAWTRRLRMSPDHKSSFEAYFSYWQPKQSGGARLIEHPKTDIKQAQRSLLRNLLNKVDPHEAAHGFLRGHSILSHARLHADKELVLRCDLKDFFLSVRASRVHVIFRYLGYNESVSRALTKLTTTRANWQVVREGKKYGVDFQTGKQYQADHLPQGAPTSPALANLAAFKLDLRLNALAEQFGVVYSRYADDLAFSGAAESGMRGERFYLRVAAIAIEEGFALNMRKTHWMPASQRQTITGLVINEKPNIAREEFDRLKAILTNAARDGLESQNRERHANFRAHLRGQIEFIRQVNPQRGEKLRRMLLRIR